jgi:hypothetical protein
MKFLYLCEDALFLVKVGVEVRGRFIEYHDVNAFHLMGSNHPALGLEVQSQNLFQGCS